MINQEKIAAHDFCLRHNVEMSFVRSLGDSGLLELTITEESVFIQLDQLPELEKLARLHYDMAINLEGLEAVYHLLGRVEGLQEEMKVLRNRLNFYERTNG